MRINQFEDMPCTENWLDGAACAEYPSHWYPCSFWIFGLQLVDTMLLPVRKDNTKQDQWSKSTLFWSKWYILYWIAACMLTGGLGYAHSATNLPCFFPQMIYNLWEYHEITLHHKVGACPGFGLSCYYQAKLHSILSCTSSRCEGGCGNYEGVCGGSFGRDEASKLKLKHYKQRY